jgi:predicted RNA-binding protein with PIN domain
MITAKRLCGSLKNKAIIIFDGFAESLELKQDYGNLEVIFSKKDNADTKIKQLVEGANNPKNIAVVSDDKEIKFFIRAIGAKAISVEDFLVPSKAKLQNELIKPELSYTQIHKINQELRKIWLE